MNKITSDCQKGYEEEEGGKTRRLAGERVTQRAERTGLDQVIKEESWNKSLNDKNSFTYFL